MMLQKIGLSTGLLVASTLATPAQMLSAINPDVVGPAPTGLVKPIEAPDVGALNENSWDFAHPLGVPGFGPMTAEDAQRAMAHIAQSAPPAVPRK
jgi:hypothetical protein